MKTKDFEKMEPQVFKILTGGERASKKSSKAEKAKVVGANGKGCSKQNEEAPAKEQ